MHFLRTPRPRRSTLLVPLATALVALVLFLAGPSGVAAQAGVAAAVDEGPRSALPWAEPEEVGIDPAGLEKLSAAMHKLVDDGQLAGVLTAVARKGKLVHWETYGQRDLASGKPVEDDTIFRIYSMTKPIVGVALMTLYDEGRFQLDDPVSKYIPQLGGLKVAVADGPEGTPELADAERDMTIRELMSHTGGLTYGIFGRSQTDILYQKANILDRDQTLEQMADKLAELPLLNPPGAKWQYSVSVDVQGYLIEVLSGKKLGEFLRERIFEPLGMTDTAFWVTPEKVERFATLYVPDNEGNLQPQPADEYLTPPTFESGGGGLVSTAHDYLRFAQMLLSGGELDGVRILKPESVALMSRNQLPEGVTELAPIYPGNLFGLDFAIVDQPSERTDHPKAKSEYWWYGIGGTWFGINPTEDLIVLGMIQSRGGRAAFQARTEGKRIVYEALQQ
ncbi:MAG TPA: serine hydrolase domain-containing protein [Thermoanaerobaculia bacterium]|nr:serine hydrolase domain-containing protein [Thermoanaerobaculia bacterium]